MTAVLQPGAAITRGGEPPRVIVPDAPHLFSERAARFRALAQDHALGDWLHFLGRLSQAQHEALQAFPAVPLPDAARLARASEHAMPPVQAQSWPRDPAWRAALDRICTALTPDAPEAARKAFERLARMDETRREALAARVLGTELFGADADLLPYVAAALQVYWTALAARLGIAGVAALDVPGVCPCCGFLPVGSVVRIGSVGTGSVAGLRYLHCALCNTQWNLVRVKCAVCDANEAIAYQQLEGEGVQRAGVVRAETCESCKSYLKIVYQDKDPHADPVADDLATLALDMLVDDLGYQRAGPNLLFVPGEG